MSCGRQSFTSISSFSVIDTDDLLYDYPVVERFRTSQQNFLLPKRRQRNLCCFRVGDIVPKSRENVPFFRTETNYFLHMARTNEYNIILLVNSLSQVKRKIEFSIFLQCLNTCLKVGKHSRVITYNA